MGAITIHLPEDLEKSIDDLVSQGPYKEKKEAIISLLRLGLGELKKREEPKVRVVPEPFFPPVKPPGKWPDHYEFKK